MNKEEKTGDVEESKDEWYYHNAKKRFEEENELNNSTLTPKRNENFHNTAPQIEHVERGNETTSNLEKVNFVSLKFPKVPKINSSNVDIKGPDFSKISESSVNIIPINFPSPPSIVVSQVDLNNRFIIRSNITNHMQIVPLQFPVPSLIETSLVDEEVYLGVKREVSPRLMPSLQTISTGYKKEEEERRKKREIPNKLYDYIEKGVGTFTYIKATGSTVIVYDEKKIGIQNSLARLAEEIAKIISERNYDPILIRNYNNLNVIKTDESGVKEGIYVFDVELFNNKESDDEIEKAFEETAPSLMGYGFKVFIVPFSAYRKYMLHLTPHYLLMDKELSSENKKAILYNLTKELLTALAYGASGFDTNFIEGKSYKALGGIDASFNLIYTIAEKYLKENYGPIYDASLNEDSPGGVESSHHKGLKDVIVYHLLKNEGLNSEDIRVEQLSECGNKPDVQATIKGKHVAIDAKTSFHKDPISEIKDAYKKYCECEDEVWVVLRPLPALLHAERIAGLLTLYDKLQVLIPVRDKNDENSIKLIPFEDFLKEVKEAYDKLSGETS